MQCYGNEILARRRPGMGGFNLHGRLLPTGRQFTYRASGRQLAQITNLICYEAKQKEAG